MVVIGRIDVRNIDNYVVKKLEEKAAQSNMSRESYVRSILTVAAESDLLEEQQNKYETLLREVIELVKEQGAIIEKNSYMMELLFEKNI